MQRVRLAQSFDDGGYLFVEVFVADRHLGSIERIAELFCICLIDCLEGIICGCVRRGDNKDKLDACKTPISELDHAGR